MTILVVLDEEKGSHQDSWVESSDHMNAECDFVARTNLASNNMENDFHIVKLFRQLPTLKHLNLGNNDLRVITLSQDDPFIKYLK